MLSTVISMLAVTRSAGWTGDSADSRRRQIGCAAATSDHSENKILQIAGCALHAIAADMLRQYSDQRKRLQYDALSDAFFISEQGGHLNYHSLLALVHQAHPQTRDVVNFGPATLPPLHSPLFCDSSNVALVSGRRRRTGASADTVGLLGDVRPQESYWYLTATPELLGTAAERFRLYATSGGER
jgi:integrase/recombinase XerD